MDEFWRGRLERLTGRAVISWQAVHGGYSPAGRWRVELAGGSWLFAKIGTSAHTAQCLRVEARHYRELAADFMPRMFGFDDDAARPLLLLEDLSSARWPPPWTASDLAALRATLARVAKTRPLPSGLSPLSVALPFAEPGSHVGWAEVRRDPAPFLGLGLCSAAWLEHALPALVEAERSAPLDGEALVHCDVRSDNLCFVGERVLLIDWNLAMRGNAAFDLAFAAPSIRLEGGPLPEELVGNDAPLAAVVSGFFAERAGLPQIPDAPRVRWIQTEQLRIALPWVARALGLGAPGLSSDEPI